MRSLMLFAFLFSAAVAQAHGPVTCFATTPSDLVKTPNSFDRTVFTHDLPKETGYDHMQYLVLSRDFKNVRTLTKAEFYGKVDAHNLEDIDGQYLVTLCETAPDDFLMNLSTIDKNAQYGTKTDYAYMTGGLGSNGLSLNLASLNLWIWCREQK